MTLEEALRIYPAEGTVFSPITASPAQIHKAGQIIADNFRRLFNEQIAVVHSVRVLRSGALRASEYSLVRTIHLDNAADLLRQLYRIKL